LAAFTIASVDSLVICRQAPWRSSNFYAVEGKAGQRSHSPERPILLVFVSECIHTPAAFLPSRNSSDAPPPVEMCVILSGRRLQSAPQKPNQPPPTIEGLRPGLSAPPPCANLGKVSTAEENGCTFKIRPSDHPIGSRARPETKSPPKTYSMVLGPNVPEAMRLGWEWG